MSHSGLNINKLDKNKTKFKAIEINKVFKGSSIESQKTSGPTRQHGLQTLGMVGPTRRVPPPAHLPSLKSEHGYLDPSVSLVPSGGSGWGGNNKDEDKITQPVAVSVASGVPPQFVLRVTAKATVQQEGPHNDLSTSSSQLWSNVTSGKTGSLLSKKQFQEEFPELAANTEERSHSSPKEDEKQESRCSVGPSLRPQNMSSWKEGGGRKQTIDEEENEEDSQEPIKPHPASDDEDADGRRRLQRPDYGGYRLIPPFPTAQAGAPGRLMRPPIMPPMMGRMPGTGGPPPPAHMMYGPPMLPHQFMYPRPGYGPPPFSNYMPPHLRHAMPYPRPEHGFHTGMPGMPPHMRMPPSNGLELSGRDPSTAIVKDQSLKEFDKISSWEGGWAEKAATEVDYSKKLEFSDDEDDQDRRERNEKHKSIRSESQEDSSKLQYGDLPARESTRYKDLKLYDESPMFGACSRMQTVISHDSDKSRKAYEARDPIDKERSSRSNREDYRTEGQPPQKHFLDWNEESRNYGRRKAPESFKIDEGYRPPSKSFRNEEERWQEAPFEYDSKYCQYPRYKMGYASPPSSTWNKYLPKKEEETREYDVSFDPMKTSKSSSYKEYNQSSVSEVRFKKYNDDRAGQLKDEHRSKEDHKNDDEEDNDEEEEDVNEEEVKETVSHSGLEKRRSEQFGRHDSEDVDDRRKDGYEEKEVYSTRKSIDRSPERGEFKKSSLVERNSPKVSDEKPHKVIMSPMAHLKDKKLLLDKSSALGSSRCACPPPISLKYTKQDLPPQSNYIPLKKSANNSVSTDANVLSSSLTSTTVTSSNSLRSAKNLRNDFDQDIENDSKEYSSKTATIVDETSAAMNKKNWADSIEEEEQQHEKMRNVWQDKKREHYSFDNSLNESPPVEELQKSSLGSSDRATGSSDGHNRSSDKQRGGRYDNEKFHGWSSSSNRKDYSRQSENKHGRFDDRSSASKKSSDEYHEDGYGRNKNLSRGSHFASRGNGESGYQEFSRSSNYNRISNSQQYKKSNYQVLTSHKSSNVENSSSEKEQREQDLKVKSENSSKPEVKNPWRTSLGSRDEKNDSISSHQRSADLIFGSDVSQKQSAVVIKKMEVSANGEEGSGDGIKKETDLNRNMDVAASSQAQHRQESVRSAWLAKEGGCAPLVHKDYGKETFEVAECQEKIEVDSKKAGDSAQVELVVAFTYDSIKEGSSLESTKKETTHSLKSTIKEEQISSTKADGYEEHTKPPTNVWLNRQKHEQKKAPEESIQPTKNVWTRSDPFQKSAFTKDGSADDSSDNKSTTKETQQPLKECQSNEFINTQLMASSNSALPKKPPALMDMQIAKPPSSLLKESQLLSSDDLLDSDWNSTDNVSIPSRKSDRRSSGYSRSGRGTGSTVAASSHRRRMTAADQQQDSYCDQDVIQRPISIDEERDGRYKRGGRAGHLYKYAESGRRNRGFARVSYKSGSVGDCIEETEHYSVSKQSEERKKSRQSYTRGEPRSFVGDKRSNAGSTRGRRHSNKMSASSGAGGGAGASNGATNESDFGNEEWETASESSDVLQNNQHQKAKSSRFEEEKSKQAKQFFDGGHLKKEAGGEEVQSIVGNIRSRREDGGSYGKSARSLQGKRFPQKRESNNMRKNSTNTGQSKSNHFKTNDVEQQQLQHSSDKTNHTSNQKSSIATTSSSINENVSDGLKTGDLQSQASNNQTKHNKTSKVESPVEFQQKTVKYEREKKDVLAGIDVNNYASVVVVDNHPEVSIDDPSFLFEKNEGFQEVTSRKAMKSKMKAAQLEEALKKSAEQQKSLAAATAAAAQSKKIEKEANKARASAASTGNEAKQQQRPGKQPASRTNRSKDSKRTGVTNNAGISGRKFSISEDDRTINNSVLPKIENWNNDMAKSIPPMNPTFAHSQSSTISTTLSMPVSAAMFSSNTVNLDAASSLGNFGSVQVSQHLATQDQDQKIFQPRYGFQVDNWEKESKSESLPQQNTGNNNTSHIFAPISMSMSGWSDTLLVSQQQKMLNPIVVVASSDPEGHMSNVDQRDQQAQQQQQNKREASVEKKSLSSSSPNPTACRDIQMIETAMILQQPIMSDISSAHVSSSLSKQSDSPTCEGKHGVHVLVTDETRAIKKPEVPGCSRPQQQQQQSNARSFEPLDIQSSMYEYKQGGDSSDIKLDFTFDASLQTKLPESDKKTIEAAMSNATNLSSIAAAGASNNSSGMPTNSRVELMSASDEDLGYKLARVKNVWDRENPINYEQGMISSGHRTSTKHAAPTSSMSLDINDQLCKQQTQSYLAGMSSSVSDRIVPVAPNQVDNLDSSTALASNPHHQPPPHMSYPDNELSFKDSSVDSYLSDQPNVCKVKPQLQASLATPSLNQLSGVASPPTPAQHLMIAFGQGSYTFGSQLLTPDCGIGLPFGQPAYLAAPATQTPLLAPLAITSQPSLFLGHTQNMPNEYYNCRNLFGLTQQQPQQPSTIMVSSTTSSLMSTAIKAQSQHHQYISSGSKQQANTLPAAFQYGQLLGNSSLIPQPSQISLQYEPAQYSALQHEQAIMPPSNSQIVGSHLLSQRNPAAIHGSSAFYPQTLLQQSCFQQQRSSLPASFQQYQLPGTFNVQPVALSVAAANGAPVAAANLNFQAQQPLANQSQLKHSAPPFKPSSQRLALSPNQQKFSVPGVFNSNFNKSSLLSYHLQQEQQNTPMLSSSFLMQQNIGNNMGSNLSNQNIGLSNSNLSQQYQLFTQQQLQQQLQQTIQMHQQQQQSATSSFLTQQQAAAYSIPSKDRYGPINQQNKYQQSQNLAASTDQYHQKYDQFSMENSSNESQQQIPLQQSASSSMLPDQFKRQSGKALELVQTGGNTEIASKSSSPALMSAVTTIAVSASSLQSVTSSSSDVGNPNASSSSAAHVTLSTSFNKASSASSVSSFSLPSSGSKWNPASNFTGGSTNYQASQYQHQPFGQSPDRFGYGYPAGPKPDMLRDNSQTGNTVVGGAKSVAVRTAVSKGEVSGYNGGSNNNTAGHTFHSGLLRSTGVVSAGGTTSSVARPDRAGGYYSINPKDMKDIQAEERKKAMLDIQSFLNPENKPPQKLAQNVPVSLSTSSYLQTPTGSKPPSLADVCDTAGSAAAGEKDQAGVANVAGDQ